MILEVCGQVDKLILGEFGEHSDCARGTSQLATEPQGRSAMPITWVGVQVLA